ncbi:S8 family peptidase [Caulobacter sp. KR2-114]|uniref:S8 family peptidase n=1 Tax=Caulobacter sp. KR2-114 TaxID=3400912 RepID=UPI003BFE326F
MSYKLLASASALALLFGGQAVAGADRSAAWQAQIGDTAAVQATAKGGAGITIGIVDTGIAASNQEVTGRVLGASSCAAVTFRCSNGVYDDNSHGTAVAAIAAGSYSPTPAISMSGVAPSATILSEKVLNASGTGMNSDIANGITKAVNGGAQVINLSLTYMTNSDIISAVNYAASKNVVIVWAGGNSSANLNNGANTSGLSAAALQRLILVGSVGSNNQISSFSNKPGSGKAGSTAYSSLWLMGNGDSIIAPGLQYGSTSFAYWTGTSMAAPEVAGAVALLEATWPVLMRNGTAAQVLFLTATDLGTKGVDSTYGNGLLNINQAFQPIGALTVTQANGKSTPVSSLTSAMITSGALGNLSAIRSQLSAYTTFDSFQRNFTSNLSGLVSTSSVATVVTPAPVSVSTPTTLGRHLAGGGFVMATGLQPVSFGEAVFGDSGANDVADRMFGARDRGMTAVMLADGRGDVAAVSRGMNSSAAFAQAFWGVDAPAADLTSHIGASTALLNLAQGGNASAIGASLGGRVRLAAGWSATDETTSSGLASNRTLSGASAAVVGATAQVTRRWTLGVSYSGLKETNGLLGSTYDGAGLLSFGGQHRSREVSISTAYDLGSGRSLLAEAAWVSADGAKLNDGLIRDVSNITARAWGVSFVQVDALRAGDSLTVSIRKPLRVSSGTADLAVTTVDDQGYAHTGFTRVGLTPDGNETDLDLAYGTVVRGALRLGGEVDFRSDAQNVRGQNDVAFRLAANLRF